MSSYWSAIPGNDGSEGRLTCEVDIADVLEQQRPVDGLHLGAQAHVAGAQAAVHVVQGVGHGVHGVDHKLHLALLLVGGVPSDSLVI